MSRIDFREVSALHRSKHRATTTSLTVAGVGAAVTGVGRLIGGPLGAGITGFGLAHVALGLLDMARPSVRNDS